MRTAAIALGTLALLAQPAAGAPANMPGDGGAAWLSALRQTVAADLIAGKPLVIHAHVAMCDNRIINCGAQGNGDNPKKNLYWTTSAGFRGWHGRNGGGWTEVKPAADWKLPDKVLDVAVYRRRVTPDRAWRALGVSKPFEVVMVGWAWRGIEIDAMLETYTDDLYGTVARPVHLAGGEVIEAGGAAHIVAYVGHNRWMDRERYDFAAAAKRAGANAKPKGTIAIACKTDDYLGDEVPSGTRVPLVLTTDFMFAGSGALEGAARSFADGGTMAQIRTASATGYASAGNKPVARVKYAFTNPSDKRWRKR